VQKVKIRIEQDKDAQIEGRKIYKRGKEEINQKKNNKFKS